MSRGLTDPIPEPGEEGPDQQQIENVITALINSQNKLHDRIVDLERKLDNLTFPPSPLLQKKKWKRGL